MDLETMLNERKKPADCSNCGNALRYVGAGKYSCDKCGHVEYDDFGKVREYLETHGPTPAYTIAKELGIPVKVISKMLKDGRLQIPKGETKFTYCSKCGCAIRFGQYCDDCSKELMKNAPKGHLVHSKEDSVSANARMRFIDGK